MLISEKKFKMKSYIEVQNDCPQWDSNLQPLGEYMHNHYISFISKNAIIWSKLKMIKLKYLIVQTYCKRNCEAALLIKPIKNIQYGPAKLTTGPEICY